jgi:hypothetical protein
MDIGWNPANFKQCVAHCLSNGFPYSPRKSYCYEKCNNIFGGHDEDVEQEKNNESPFICSSFENARTDVQKTKKHTYIQQKNLPI